MNIRSNLQASVPFSSLKQGDLFWSHAHPAGLYIKLRVDSTPASHYAYNSYRVGEEKGGGNFFDDELVTPVNEVVVS